MEHFIHYIGLLQPYSVEKCDYRYYVALEDGSGMVVGDDPYEKFSASWTFTPKHPANHRPGNQLKLEDLPIKVWAALIIIIRSRHMQYEAHKREVRNRTLSVILDRLDNKLSHRLRYVDYYSGVAEPGYDDVPMFCSDWNPDKASRFYNWAERYFEGEVEFDWYDEWSHCTQCYKAIRTSPDCYAWLPAYLEDDYDRYCRDCVDDDPESWIESYMNTTNRALMDWFDTKHLKEAGFHCFEDDDYCKRFETGFHPGQTDDPAEAVKAVKDVVPYEFDYIFQITGRGQFDMYWSMWIRPTTD
jgi:hypothetical protein